MSVRAVHIAIPSFQAHDTREDWWQAGVSAIWTVVETNSPFAAGIVGAVVDHFHGRAWQPWVAATVVWKTTGNPVLASFVGGAMRWWYERDREDSPPNPGRERGGT